MKVEISDGELFYLSSLLDGVSKHAKGDFAKKLKYLARRLQPPKTDIKLSAKNLAFLLLCLEQSLLALGEGEARADHEKVLTSILKKIKES